MQIVIDGKPSRGLSAKETKRVSVDRGARDAVLEGGVWEAAYAKVIRDRGVTELKSEGN